MLIKKRYLFSTLILFSPIALAGDLNPSTGPANTSSYTLQDICNRLETGAAGTQQNFTEPASGPNSTGCTLNEVMGKAPAVNAEAAEPADVATGTKYWGLTDGNWGLKTGTNAFLITCNGTMNGERWCDNEDGTVTDMTTGLVWLQKADWGGRYAFACLDGVGKCTTIFDRVSKLKSGESDANLRDGSVEGDWRIPTKTEFRKLVNDPERVLSDNMRAFSGVQSRYYWSATAAVHYSASDAWRVYLYDGHNNANDKSSTVYVWPVRSRH